MEIQKFNCNMLRENCYVVSDSSCECVIIDCGAFYEEERLAIKDYISQKGLRPVALVATHGHVDHNLGNNTIFESYGLKVGISAKDEDHILGLKKEAQELFGLSVDYDLPPVGHYFSEDETIRFGSHEFTIIPTPGHSRGSVCFYCEAEHVLFSGDTLFQGIIGRTDFQGGSMFQMIQSLRELAQLPDQTTVYPGHGNSTTIGYELASNPYMDR